MSNLTQEQGCFCPHCGERVSLLLDLSAGGQSYIEDCEVCCAPMVVRFEVENGALCEFQVEAA